MKLRYSYILVVACSIFMFAGYCSAAKPVKKEMSIQLYSARDLIGKADQYAKSHEEVLKALAKMGYTSVTGKLYEGYRHEILQEEIAKDIYQDVLNFIEK